MPTQKQEKFMSSSLSKSSQLIKFKKIKLSFEGMHKNSIKTPDEDCTIEPDCFNDTPLAGTMSMIASQTFL
jgi:hypothetical protein